VRGILVAEQVRIEQVSELVGGRENMANNPYKNPASLEHVRNWFLRDKYNELPGWPDWLKYPYDE
jgi:hypothetical protein